MWRAQKSWCCAVAMHQLGVKTKVARYNWCLSVNLWFRQMHNLQEWCVIIKSRLGAWSWNCVELCWHDISFKNIFPDLNCESRTITSSGSVLSLSPRTPRVPSPFGLPGDPGHSAQCGQVKVQVLFPVWLLQEMSRLAARDQQLRGGGRHPPHLRHQSGHPRGEHQSRGQV